MLCVSCRQAALVCAHIPFSPSLSSPSDTMFNIWESQDRKVDTYKTVRQRGRVGEVGHGSGQERRGWWSVVRRADGGGAQVIEFLMKDCPPRSPPSRKEEATETPINSSQGVKKCGNSRELECGGEGEEDTFYVAIYFLSTFSSSFSGKRKNVPHLRTFPKTSPSLLHFSSRLFLLLLD